ncbi:Ribosomal L11 methyltransferase [Candidatus Magnetoovum chiemensis]|nr:Ribosomal L11 methyltransferase [Candidatus Magnetoovum chiemensis]
MLDENCLKVAIYNCSEAQEQISALMFSLGSYGIEHKDNSVIAYFPLDYPSDAIKLNLDASKAILQHIGIPSDFTYTLSILEGRDWTEEWKKGLEPVEINDTLVILAPWHKYDNKCRRHRIIIEPGMAFGTGHHTTTVLCLRAVSEASHSLKGAMLDIGTGTGILAIAGAQLGFSPICVTEKDERAIKIAQENFSINNITNAHFADTSLNIADRKFSLITCNITAAQIKRLIVKIVRLKAENGMVILSGILTSQEDEILAELSRLGVYKYKILYENGWICIIF